MRIEITREVLFDSASCKTENLNTNCAIAEAVADVFPNTWIGGGAICFLDDSGNVIASTPLPEEATEFIAEFDRLTPVQRVQMEPIGFDIVVPSEVIDSINLEEIEEHLLLNLTS